MDSPGELDRYRIIRPLGTGGMASVVLAEDVVLQRRVALKRLTGSALLGDDRQQSLSRLRREALLGASVSHPNLVSVYDVIATADHELVIVMEYVEGETLAERLLRERRMPAPQALAVLQGVAAGLQAIHARAIVHRDVKPANVLLGSDGRVKLADLGIAAVSDRTQITTAGTLLGTFRYMAPEQLEDLPATPAIDIYALAAVAFEVLSGQRARQEPNPIALAHAVASQPPPDLREAWPAAPPAAARLLAQAMARDPAARPSSAVRFIDDLRRALETEAAAVAPVPASRRPARAPRARAPLAAEPARRKRRRPAWIASGALAAVVAAAGILISANGSSSRSGAGAGVAGTRTESSPASARGGPAGGRRRTARGSAPGGAAGTQAGGHSGSTTATSGTGATATSGPSASTGGNGPAASSPVTAVESFYHLAAAHDYAAAWNLADPSFRAQLGGYPSFANGQSADRSIVFDQAALTTRSPTSATVSIRTTSVRDSGTQHCSGTVDVLAGGAGGEWLLHQIHITCQ